MNSTSEQDFRFVDPFSETTRKERRTLINISFVCIVVVKAGLIPTKIESLGLDFTQTNQNMLVLILMLINLYFLITCILYITVDYIAWAQKIKTQRLKNTLNEEHDSKSDNIFSSIKTSNLVKRQRFESSVAASVIYLIRLFFDILFPFVIGIVAIVFCIIQLSGS